MDRYQVSRELGRGGMAVVYLARQVELDRWVALKELHADDPSAVKRFLRESRLAGSLTHPNIVTVLDFFEAEGSGYIAMEYVPHGSLRRYVGGLSFAQVAGVLEGVLAALACAEREGIVHRDVKPENVMVTADGRVKLADFGIAKATGAGSMLTAAGTTLGTPHYMAPEQAMAQDVGPWTDLYSVGCMAYELVTGQLPFGDSDAPMAILLRHINELPAPAATRGADPHLSEWIAALMAKAPADRPQSAVEAWEALEEIILDAAGPRWRRSAALPTHGTQQIPGPMTPPPSGAVPSEPIFQTFHAPPPSRPPTDPGAPTVEPPPAAETPPPAVEPTAPGEAPPPRLAASTAPAATAAPSVPLADPSPSAFVPPTLAGRGEAFTPPPPPAPRPRRRRTALAAVALVLVTAAAGGAVLLTGDDPPPPPPRQPSPKQAVVAPPVPLQAGKVRVELPGTWRALSLPIDVPGLPREGVAAPGGQESDGVVFVGLAPRDAHRPGLLSRKLGDPGSSPEEVQLGTLAAYRHQGLSWNGRGLTVYAAPTGVGVVTVACLAPTPVGDCRRIAESLQVDGATGFPLGADPAFARAASRALDLPTRSPRSAGRIAADYRAAHHRVARATSGPADQPLRDALLKRLDALADAYGALGTAAADYDRSGYARAAKRARTAASDLRTSVHASLYRDLIDVPRPRAIPPMRPRPAPSRPPAVEPHVTPQPGPGPPRWTPGPGPRPRPGPCTAVPCGGKPAPEPTDPDFGGGQD